MTTSHIDSIIGENANDVRLTGFVDYLTQRFGYRIISTTIEKMTDEEPYMISCVYPVGDKDAILNALNDWCKINDVLHRSLISGDEHDESIVIELLNLDILPCNELNCFGFAEHDGFCPEHSL